MKKIEYVNVVITRVLNCTRKKVKGMRRRVPCTKEKIRVRDTILHWKVCIRKTKGIQVEAEVTESRKLIHNIDSTDNASLEIAKQKLNESTTEWNEIK